MKTATAPGEEIAPEEVTGPGEETARKEETAPEEETAREEESAPEEETAPEEKQKIPEIGLPYLLTFHLTGFIRSFQSWYKKFLDSIRGKLPVTQSFTVNNRQDFKNRMTRSTPSPVVLRQTRGKLPSLVVPSAIHGTFRRITEGKPCSRKVNMCFSALQEVENNITLASFWSFMKTHSASQPDLHPTNIIDLDIGPHQRTMKRTFSIPNLTKEYSLGHTHTSRIDPSIREEFDFTAGISNYLLMTEQEAHCSGRRIGIRSLTELLFFTFC